MQTVKTEVVALFSKVWVVLLYISIGMIGKFSNDLLTGRRLTLKQAIGQAGVCLFCGFLSWVVCNHFGWEKLTGIICPIVTYVSDKLMIAIYSLDWKDIILNIVSNLTKKN